MNLLLANVVPLVFLILFGVLLRRVSYFEEVAMQRITNMVANLLVPCVIFTTFLGLDMHAGHIGLAVCFAAYQLTLLLASWAIYRVFHVKRRFFLFFHCAFAFGFMAVPLFSTVFGAEHMDSLVAMGIGHELFVGLIFLTTAKLHLTNERPTAKAVAKKLLSPLFIMIAAALLIKLFGLRDAIATNIIGKGFFDAVAKLGSMTTVLTMIIVGYRIRFNNRAHIGESIRLVAIRYALTFGIGYLFKYLFMNRLAGGDPYFGRAFFTLLSQHGSVVLTAFVGEYGSREDLEIASNAFVINAIVGIVLYLIFVALLPT